MRISRQNNQGFTLVELMMAMLITLVGLLGLLQAVNMAVEHNMRNQLRDEATHLAERMMGDLKVRPFNRISGVSSPKFSSRPVNSALRGGSFRYSVFRPCTTAGPTAAQLSVNVTWTYKGVPYSHQVRTIRSQ